MFKNTLTKIYFFFLIIVFILSLLGICGLTEVSHSLEEQINATILENTQNVASNLNSSLDMLHSQNCGLVSQSNILKLAKTNYLLEEYEKITYINQLREQITSIADSNPFVENVRIYFHHLNKVYNSSGYPGGSFHSLTSEQYMEIFSYALPGGTSYYPNPLTGENTLSIFIYSVESKNDFMIEIVLSQDYINDIFSSNAIFGSDYYYATIYDSIVLTNLPDTLLADFDISVITNTTKNNYQYHFENQPYFCNMQEIPFLHCRYFRLVSSDNYTEPITSVANMIIYILITLSVSSLLFLYIAHRFLHTPLQKLKQGFNQLEKGNFSVSLPSDKSTDFNYIYQSFNSMTQTLYERIELEYRMNLLLQKAEFKQLQSQINPHFLYNSFFILKRTIKDGLFEEAEKMASLLGKYFKYITRNNIEQVTLKDEYQHAVLYSEIQALRFERRIKIYLEPLPERYEELSVPKLILQPIMENAFLHGLDHKINDGILSLRFLPEKDTITIFIEDNSETLTDDVLLSLQEKLMKAELNPDSVEMTGLLNIKRRISLYSDHKSKLSISRSSLGGLCVSIYLSCPK